MIIIRDKEAPLGTCKGLQDISFLVGVIAAIIGIISLLIILIDGKVINCSGKIDVAFGMQAGTFIAGFVGTCFSIAGTALILSTFISQNRQNARIHLENTFFKYIETHYANIKQIKIKNSTGVEVTGLSAFIFMRSQLAVLLQIVKKFEDANPNEVSEDTLIDFAYMKFMYGSECDFKLAEDMSIETKEALCYEIEKLIWNKTYLGEAYHVFLGSYMRNIYNAIKFIDAYPVLNSDEKNDYVKILRSQISNPELYIFYHSIRARFGKKWKKYIKKYQLLDAMPDGYCKEFDHKIRYPVLKSYKYEADELGTRWRHRSGRKENESEKIRE
jgi:hypothetical protein